MKIHSTEPEITWGQYRSCCVWLAGVLDDLGQSGKARYLESCVHGIADGDPTPLPIARTMCDELGSYYRTVLGLLAAQQAQDQAQLWKLQARMEARIKQIRIAGMYHTGAGYRTPCGHE